MFAVQLTGQIEVLDPESGRVIPPVSIVLDGRYETREEAEASIERMQNPACRTRNRKQVVEVQEEVAGVDVALAA